MRKVIRKNRKSAQLQISFGMIFSIILITVFIVFAFFGIRKFINFQDQVIAKKFINNLNSDLKDMWGSSRGSQEVAYLLPNKVEQVCFKNDEQESVYFISEENFGGGILNYVNFEKTLVNKRELCIPVKNKEVILILKKDYGEELVTITSQDFQQIEELECISHAFSKCYGGDVWWYNSCNLRETRKQHCNSNQECINGFCIGKEIEE